jgi:hypothetical protein
MSVAPERRLNLLKGFFMAVTLTVGDEATIFQYQRAVRHPSDEAEIVARNQYRHAELVKLLKQAHDFA